MKTPKLSRRQLKPDFWSGDKPIVIAHRGGDAAGVAKENTLAAFRSAAKLGYEYGETDVVLTADGQVIAVHGTRSRFQSLFKRRQLPRPALQRMTLEQIHRDYSIGGEPVPLLAEVLESQPNMRFFIDAKTDEVVEPLAEILKSLNALGRVSVGSFSYERVQRLVKLLDGQTSTQLNIARTLGMRNNNLELLKSGRLKDVAATHLHHSLVSPQMIELHHSQGIKALIWTCNSPLSIKHAIQSGADGIISDNIRLLKDILSATP